MRGELRGTKSRSPFFELVMVFAVSFLGGGLLWKIIDYIYWLLCLSFMFFLFLVGFLVVHEMFGNILVFLVGLLVF